MKLVKIILLTSIFLLLKNKTIAQNELFGVIKVSQNTYFDETEVDVASWLSYYSWTIIHEGEAKAKSVLPDSNMIEPELWKYIKNNTLLEYINFNAKYSNQPIGYFRKECQEYEKFKRRLSEEKRYCRLLDFPITGITYEQAIAFCDWRSKIQGNNAYVFQLPTPDEWNLLAFIGFSEKENKNGFKDSTLQKASPNYNFNFKSYCSTCIEVGTLFGVAMFLMDEKKFFDVFGNVSEMTSIKGEAKGGNFMLYANQCHPDSTQYYNGAQRWLGFRCVRKLKNTVIPIANLTHLDTLNNYQNKVDKLIDKRDNKSYPTVVIGKQIWMAANLAHKPDSGKYWVYDNNERNADKYGYLYTWKTAQNVCPVGWHLPSKTELEELILKLDSNPQIVYKNIIVHGLSGLNIRTTGSHVGFNFTPLNSNIILWSSTEKSKRCAWGLIVNGIDRKAYLSDDWNKPNGFPIRCIRD